MPAASFRAPVCSLVRATILLAGLCAAALGSGCAVVTVADAAVSVAATAVKVTATVVETTVDVAAAGVKAATKDDAPADPPAGQ
ncbi:hypothetical protein [Aquabacterium sp.]|uniref:hypothetical protein n=1 Tax=Aquabacterium sp. TaxID=1872578 RepID=UPI0035C7290C